MPSILRQIGPWLVPAAAFGCLFTLVQGEEFDVVRMAVVGGVWAVLLSAGEAIRRRLTS
jgi:hypothetical protein